MVIKITPQQAKRVNALLRKLCANYDDGNCLLLDDGEPCVCVQSVSKYGIYCNYFKNAVLPVDEGLHAEIMKPTGGKRCVLCRQGQGKANRIYLKEFTQKSDYRNSRSPGIGRK